MLTFQDLMSQYWKYYLALETRLLETERYVEFDLSNGTVYTELYTELEGYERNGVCLLMEGSHVSPMQVVRELMQVSVNHHSRLINVQD